MSGIEQHFENQKTVTKKCVTAVAMVTIKKVGDTHFLFN